jgi:hypothetical protein
MGGNASKNMHNQKVEPHYQILNRLTVGIAMFIGGLSLEGNDVICQTVEGDYGNHTPRITAI